MLPPTEVVLAPGARAQRGVGYFDARPGICNRSGLAAGVYEIGFALIDLAGAAGPRTPRASYTSPQALDRVQ